MVEEAKNINPIATTIGPQSPRKWPNAPVVISFAARLLSVYIPDITIVIPVMEQMINVSKNTCVMETSACVLQDPFLQQLPQ